MSHIQITAKLEEANESSHTVQSTGEVGSGGEAVLVAADLAPDIVLMDLVMPGMDGVQATRLVKQKSPRSEVIVLTSYHEDEHIFPAIRAGALSYLLKDISLPDLADAIRKAARRGRDASPHRRPYRTRTGWHITT